MQLEQTASPPSSLRRTAPRHTRYSPSPLPRAAPVEPSSPDFQPPHHNPRMDPTDAYHTLLWIYVALHLLASLVYLALSPASHPQSHPEQDTTFFVNRQARKRRPILTMSSLFALDSFAGGMVFESFVSFWFFTKFGLSAAAIGAILIAAHALNIVSLTLAPAVAKRFGLLNTLVLTQVVSNIALILFAFAPSAIFAIAIWLTRSLFDEMDVPTRQAYMMGITEPDEHPIMAGSANLGRGLGRIPSATVTGWLWAGALTTPVDRLRHPQTRLRFRHLASIQTSKGLKICKS